MNVIKLSSCLLIFCLTMQNASGQDSGNNKKTARFYFEEVCNKQRPELLGQVFADTFIVHNLSDSSQNSQTISGQAGFLKTMFKAFPDIRFRVGDVIGEGDKVSLRVTFSATHKEEFWGYKASGNRVSYVSEIFFYRFSNGKVAEIWYQFDKNKFVEQLTKEN